MSCSFLKNKKCFVFPLTGPERSSETLESAADAVRRHVRQRWLLPLGLLCGVIADGSPPLLQHRKPHRAHERQELLRHIQIGQPFCVKSALHVRHLRLFLWLLPRCYEDWGQCLVAWSCATVHGYWVQTFLSFDIFPSPSQANSHILLFWFFFHEYYQNRRSLRPKTLFYRHYFCPINIQRSCCRI